MRSFHAAVFASLGYAFHNQLEQLVAILQKLGTVSLVLIAALAAAYVVYWYIKNRSKKEAATAETNREE